MSWWWDNKWAVPKLYYAFFITHNERTKLLTLCSLALPLLPSEGNKKGANRVYSWLLPLIIFHLFILSGGKEEKTDEGKAKRCSGRGEMAVWLKRVCQDNSLWLESRSPLAVVSELLLRLDLASLSSVLSLPPSFLWLPPSIEAQVSDKRGSRNVDFPEWRCWRWCPPHCGLV